MGATLCVPCSSSRTTSARSKLFQQDGAPCHTAKDTKEWLKQKKVNLFNEGVWPPYSPDLNPVEHIWPMVTRKLTKPAYNTKDELWAALSQAFSEITPGDVLNLYKSMPARIKAVIEAKGSHTRY